MRSVSRALVGLATAAVVVALAGCSTVSTSTPLADSTRSAQPSPSSTAPSLGTTENPVRVAIVGDSLTAGGGRTIPEMGLDQNTWMTYAEGDGVNWVGGWAKGGTTVQIMADNVTPVRDVDTLVLMAGTNDVRLGFTFDQARSSYERIVAILKPEHVIIGAIPPYNRAPDRAADYERQLKGFALAEGWTFFDPWRFARDGKVYQAGISNDGIHPTTAGYRIVGREYRDAILQSVATPVAG